LDDVFVPYTYHVPAVIAAGMINDTGELYSLGCIRGEAGYEVAAAFWSWVERFQSKPSQGTLVSFNGRSFDFPVLELAALRYGIRIPQHCNEKYGNRYRFQDDWHLDVLDYFTTYGATRGLRGGLSMLSHVCGMRTKHLAKHSNLEEVPLERMQRWCRNDIRRLYVTFQRLQFVRGKGEVLPEPPELEDEK
jgi:predicted PolB exonuclease-like 3'-5' exonuclease